MNVRVRALSRFDWQGRVIGTLEELDLPERAADNLARAGLVERLDGELSGATIGSKYAPAPKPDCAEETDDVEDENPCGVCETPPGGGRSMAVCATPRCPCLVAKSGKCEGCRKAANQKHRASTQRRGHGDQEWKRFSIRYRREHPYCEGEEHANTPLLLRPPSECVDHLDGLGPNGPRGFDESNVEALCWSCHSKRTGRDFGGFGGVGRDPL